jgi:hypothetical protein
MHVRSARKERGGEGRTFVTRELVSLALRGGSRTGLSSGRAGRARVGRSLSSSPSPGALRDPLR